MSCVRACQETLGIAAAVGFTGGIGMLTSAVMGGPIGMLGGAVLALAGTSSGFLAGFLCHEILNRSIIAKVSAVVIVIFAVLAAVWATASLAGLGISFTTVFFFSLTTFGLHVPAIMLIAGVAGLFKLCFGRPNAAPVAAGPVIPLVN